MQKPKELKVEREYLVGTLQQENMRLYQENLNLKTIVEQLLDQQKVDELEQSMEEEPTDE